MEFDRTCFVPPHEGDTIFPLSPFFARLVRYAHRKPPRLAVRDVNSGIEKTYLEFLSDVLMLRSRLRENLNEKDVRGLKEGKEVYIALLAAGGYEYAVGFVAIVALGAAVVPISLLLPPEEASYFILKARCTAILTSGAGSPLGRLLAEYIKAKKDVRLHCISIAESLRPSPPPPENIRLSTGRYLDDNGPAVVIFTSGTTGPPKGAVMKRAFLHDCSEEICYQFNITESDVILHVLPVHHATGVGINFLPYIFSGACVEFRSGSLDVPWLWERWKRGGLTVFSGVPTIFMRMMRYYESELSVLSEKEQRGYVNGVRSLRILLCGTSALPEPVQDFWRGILGGKRRILTRYGSTEAGAIFRTPLDCADIPSGSVGHLAPGVTVKLSNGNEGEILVKSPWMFSKYLHNPEATAQAHDSEGFFKTGDIAQRTGDHYFILGRFSIDILKCGGYKISALDIEREIVSLPYVNEVMVVGVDDEEYGQRVAAALTLRDDQLVYRCQGNGGIGTELSIYDLRRDLRTRLAGYKMPTILRVIEGELPKNVTGKVVKKVLGPAYFPSNYRNDAAVQLWRTNRQVQAKL